jgi:nitroreductase
MEVEQAIRERRSVRRFQDRDVSPEMIEELLELASWAPSASNKQMWFFYAVHTPEIRERLARAVETKAEEIASWPEVQDMRETILGMKRYGAMIRQAPWLVIFCLEESESPFEALLVRHELPEAEIARWRPQGGLQSVVGAIENFLLAAHSRGLGAVWMVGPLFAVREIEAILEVPAGRRAVTLVPVGYPAENPAAKPRKPRAETWEIR